MADNSVAARYITGDEIILENCPTISDVRTEIAAKGSVHASNVCVLTTEGVECTNDEEASPAEVRVVVASQDLKKRNGPFEYWGNMICDPAAAGDVDGVVSAMRMVEMSTGVAGIAVAAFILCARMDKIDSRTLSTIIEARCDINFMCTVPGGRNTRISILMHACRKKKSCLIGILTEAKCDITQQDDDGWTCLHHCVEVGALRCILRILSLMAEEPIDVRKPFLNAQSKACLRTALHDASASGDIASSYMLSASDACDIDAQDENGRTPLIIASMNIHVHVLRLLVPASANLEIEDKDGMTALKFALQRKRADMEQILRLAAGEQA